MSGFSYRHGIWIIGGALAVGSTAGAGLVLASRSGGHTVAAAPLPPAAAVTSFGYIDVEEGVASLYPLQPGRVERICVRENDEAAAGTTLVQMDARPASQLSRLAQADVDAARAQLDRARLETGRQKVRESEQLAAVDATRHRLKAAQLVFARKQQLLNEAQLINEKEVAAAKEQCAVLEAAVWAEESKLEELWLNNPALDIRRAEADLAAKQARLDQARLALDECQIRAPADGSVLRILASPGDVLGPQPIRPAIIFCPNRPRIVRAEVAQEFAAGVAAGQLVVVRDDSRGGAIRRGRVRRLSDWYSHRRSIWQDPMQNNDVRTLECLIDVDPGQWSLRIGQRVLVQIAVEKKDKD
jgi:multidrug resistance efflux pump